MSLPYSGAMFPYTDYNTYNLDYIVRELGDKITSPDAPADGNVLKWDDTVKKWIAGSAQAGVLASEVVMTPQTIINTSNVQAGLAKVNTELANRPVKSIRLNNVPITPDANGVVNIQIPDGNSILY